MKKKTLCLALVFVLCLGILSGCSFKLPWQKDKGADIESTENLVVETTINMMDLEGVYSEQLAHRGTLRLTAKDSQSASIVIDWPGSASESAHWEMTGTYDPQKQAIVYNDAVMTEQTFNESGTQSNRLVSSSGTGRFTVSGKNLAWTDDLAYIGSDPATFVYSGTLADAQNASSLVNSSTGTAQTASTTPAPSASTAPAATPTPTPTPAPTPTPVPTVAPGSPVITKDPTDETVPVGGSCWFVANHKGAILARWHFVAPDGTDLQYDEAAKKFPDLNIHNGEYDSMKLSNIPAELNGYRFYCRFSNNNGSVDSKSALLTVEGAGGNNNANNTNNTETAATTDPSKAPKITKDPTDETVKPGETAWFVAKHTGAILARWHFVSPEGADYVYSDDAIAKEFPQMKIVNGDQGTMQLQNIPLNANGWKVYCRYSNNFGTADTKTATINVQAAAATPTPTAETTLVTDNAAEETITGTPASDSTVLVSDWTETPDLDSAISISGVDITVPEDSALPSGTNLFGYRAKAGIIEADYSDTNSMTIRKSTTVGGNDLIGDYTNYSMSWTQDVSGLSVSCRGDGTTANAVTYGANGANYSISYNMGKEGSGLTAEEITALVNGIK